MTLKQKIVTGIAVMGMGLAALCGGCETVPEQSPNQAYQNTDPQGDRNLKEASRLAGGLLFGMAASGAGDSGDPERDLALRGAASGAQYETRNYAIRNAGGDNRNNNEMNQIVGYYRLIDLDNKKDVIFSRSENPAAITSYMFNRNPFPKNGYLIQYAYTNGTSRQQHMYYKDLDGKRVFSIRELDNQGECIKERIVRE
ncbi:MAG: hypothetical protein PHH54_02915 [Candidatus Nanoarchaeia archaeon]|nr:hypothetical protein [Candidatus Nanoarchaeia archaeon]MDD5740911.1 hypothetical protein [Candidatus Nanoarchaeia archaeon]